MIEDISKKILMRQAIQYKLDHPSIDTYAIAVQFRVDVSRLRHEIRKEQHKNKKDK